PGVQGPRRPVRVVRFPAGDQPADRPYMARIRPLSRCRQGRSACGGAGLLQAVLPRRTDRGRSRRLPRGRRERKLIHTGVTGADRPARMRAATAYGLAAALLTIVVLVALSVGKFPVSPERTFAILWNGIAGTAKGLDPTLGNVIWNV